MKVVNFPVSVKTYFLCLKARFTHNPYKKYACSYTKYHFNSPFKMRCMCNQGLSNFMRVTFNAGIRL